MRHMLIAVLIAMGFGGAAHADPTGDALSAKARDCITAAAPKVAARSHELTDAVNFLVNDLCVVEIQHFNTYAQSKRTLEQLQATAASAQLAGITIDADTGELNTPPGFTPPPYTTTLMLNSLRAVTSPSSQFRSLAAKAVLAAEGR